MTFRLEKSVLIPLAIHTALFVLLVTGVIPRQVALYWTLGLLVWASVVDTKTSVLFFIAAIPLFIAIPITPEYDNLTMWRPLSIVIFLRWFLGTYSRHDAVSAIRWLYRNLRRLPSKFPIASSFVLLFFIGTASLLVAPDIGVGIRRIILYTNAALIPIVLFWLMKRRNMASEQVLSALVYSVIVVTVAAFLQVISTYFIDIYQFMRIWGEGIQLRQFGALWSQIAISFGNTWFAYYGAQLSLRVFSLFPDSHSFPVFLVFALGAPMAFAVRALRSRAGDSASLWQLLKTRTNLGVVWIPLALLAVILSGTRGIWAAAAGLPFISLFIWFLLKRARNRRALWLWISSFLVVTALLFAVAYPIFISPQFRLSKGNFGIFTERIRSILDINETSNRQRIAIWSSSLQSIKERPVLGVGIGNFPVVLDQRIFLARAGSTAHNIYLHIASEMGLLALGAWLWLWAVWYRRIYRHFRDETDSLWLGYDGWMLLAVPWVAAYLLTDAALFDERTLLLFGVSVVLITARTTTQHE